MGNLILKRSPDVDQYLFFSTNVDAPVSDILTREQVELYALEQQLLPRGGVPDELLHQIVGFYEEHYGDMLELKRTQVAGRLQRADSHGSSSQIGACRWEGGAMHLADTRDTWGLEAGEFDDDGMQRATHEQIFAAVEAKGSAGTADEVDER